VSMVAIVCGLLLYYYGNNCGIETGIFPAVISFAGTLCTLIFLPYFTHALLCISMDPPHKAFFGFLSVLYGSAAFVILPGTEKYNLVGPFAGHVNNSITLGLFILYGIIFYGILGYCFILGLSRGKTIGDRSLRKISTVTFTSGLLFLPFLVFFSVWGKQSIAVIFLALMFLSISIINSYYSICYFSQPAYFQDHSLTGLFCRQFQISKREKDILMLLLEGMANKEISAKLSISVRTVENHLARIYLKTETSGRMQVVNLIRSHST
jgi:DNA-binding CsgD family transcriptional regulator